MNCNVSADAVDVEIDNGGLATLGEEEGAVAVRIHKEILDQNARGQSVAQDVEFGFKVRVTVGVVGDETLAGQVESGSIIQAGGQFISFGVAASGVCGPAGDIVPAVAHTGGVAVNGNEYDIVFTHGMAEGVDTAATLRQGYVFLFWNKKPGIVVEVCEHRHNPSCYLAVP